MNLLAKLIFMEKWQLKYFFVISENADLKEVKKLYN